MKNNNNNNNNKMPGDIIILQKCTKNVPEIWCMTDSQGARGGKP